jgi:hypothetical protein
MKEKKQKPKFVRICPNCNSLDVFAETPGASANIVFGLPTMFRCRNCGFSSYVFPEVDINEMENKNKVEKQGNEDEIDKTK